MKYERNKDYMRDSRLGHAKPAKIESLKQKRVVVQSFKNELEAEIAKGHLEAGGIEANIAKDDVGGMLPSLQQTGGVQLMVDEKLQTKAKGILRKKLR
jgi:hypothetical protein